MTVTFEFEGQPYSAEVDGGQVVMLRQLRRIPSGQFEEVTHWEYPERIAGAINEARLKAGLAVTAATSGASGGSASSDAAYRERTRGRGQRL